MTEITPTTKRWNYPITLHGTDLWSKGGFQDGDILDEHIWEDDEINKFNDLLYKEKDHNCFDRICTIALAELFLLPKFDRPLTLYFANYCHNACRVEEDEWWDINDYEFYRKLPSIEIPVSVVYDMMYSMKRAYEAWLGGADWIAFPPQLKQTARILSEEIGIQIKIDNIALEFPCSPNLLPSADNK